MIMKAKKYVWDPLVRFFHWGLVLSFIIAYLTGEEESLAHVYAGYTILGLILVRLIWGFVGPHHARFSDFVRSPLAVMKYLKNLIAGNAENYIGHNPAAGWMVIALLVSLTLTGVSGLKLYGLEGHGPLANQVTIGIATARADEHNEAHERHEDGEAEEENGDEHDEDGEDFWEEIHEVLANITVFLVLLHIAGVVLSSFYHRQNLVKSMITGYKTVE